jgi:hypothetical protein
LTNNSHFSQFFDYFTAKKFLQRYESIVFLRGEFQDDAELNIFSPNKQEKIILAPQTSADKDDAITTNASATRATGGQQRTPARRGRRSHRDEGDDASGIVGA